MRPDDAQSQVKLAQALQAEGKLAGALAAYERAVALKPDFIEALYALGSIHDLGGRRDAAAKWYRWALAVDPHHQAANLDLVTILESEGRLHEASVFRDRVVRPVQLDIETAPEPRRTVLIPAVGGPGNVPLHSLLPPKTTTRIRWYVDYATDRQEAQLPPHDVVFNSVGNADLMDPSFDRLARCHERQPMLNPPTAVARTRRDRLPDLLAGIPNVVVPRVLRIRRDEVIDTDLAATLAAGGLAGPVIVRPIVTHSGGGVVLAETAQQLAALTFGDADAFYFIAYHDFRAADGHYRKYRTIFVDRQPYPYHLAIADTWLVHYYSAGMDLPWKRAEETRFLENPDAALGPDTTAAIAAIGHRMDLDFAGVDYSVLPDGRVLVFEANPTMSVYLPKPGEAGADQPSPASAIITAFGAMLDRHGNAR